MSRQAAPLYIFVCICAVQVTCLARSSIVTAIQARHIQEQCIKQGICKTQSGLRLQAKASWVFFYNPDGTWEPFITSFEPKGFI